MRRRVGAVLLVGLVGRRVLARHRKRVDLVTVVVFEAAVFICCLEHAEAECVEPATLPGDPSMLRARNDVVPRRRQEGRDLVADAAVRLIVGRQERADLGVGGEAIA